MNRAAVKIIASASSGIAVGASGMYSWDRWVGSTLEANKEEEEEEVVSTPRSIAGPDPSIASDFVMPFVERYGFPDLDQVILPSQEYTSCWDTRTRNARWVVERINADTINGGADRAKSEFRPDPRLEPLFRSNRADYYKSGYDRGHLAPAGDHKTTQSNLDQTFLLSNMAPQTPSFNRGYWSDFEEFVRALVVPEGRTSARRPPPVTPPFKDVYVITGPLYLPSRELVPAAAVAVDDVVDADGDAIIEVPSLSAIPLPSKWVVKHDIIGSPMQMVAVPTHFFKVIVAEPFQDNSTTTFVAAFAMPNERIENGTDLRNFLVPLEALESVAGMRFLGAMSGTGLFNSNPRISLDNEAMAVRAKAGVPQLSVDWGVSTGSGYRQMQDGEEAVVLAGQGDGTNKLFRHLCTTASCVGL